MDFELSAPSISLQDLVAPMGGKPLYTLSLACYQVRSNPGPGPRELWSPANDRLDGQFKLKDEQPLTLGLLPSLESERAGDWHSHDTVVVVRVETLDKNGQYQPTDYSIRISFAGGEGAYTPSDVTPSGESATWQRIDPLLLT